jgi:Uma2 family endonuclease
LKKALFFMETQAVEIIETEVVLEEAMSLNHSRLIGRLTVLLSAYEEQYDILPELEFELTTGNLKPDIAVLHRQAYDWEEDIIRFPSPPITAIEVLSPTQAFDAVASKIRKLYFPAGVESAWLVVPSIKTIHLFLPGQPVTTVSTGILHDPATGIDLAIEKLFR